MSQDEPVAHMPKSVKVDLSPDASLRIFAPPSATIAVKDTAAKLSMLFYLNGGCLVIDGSREPKPLDSSGPHGGIEKFKRAIRLADDLDSILLDLYSSPSTLELARELSIALRLTLFPQAQGL
jgi:hypothetical protein